MTVLLGDPATGNSISLSDFSDRTSFFVKHAMSQISSDFGDEVKILNKKLLAPGLNPDLAADTEETIWLQGGIETFVSSNAIDTISSSSASDTDEVLITGHSISGGNFARVVQTVTLNGQSKVLLGTPLARVDFIKNNSGANWQGDVYVYEDGNITSGVPDTASSIHAKGDQTRNRSFKASATSSDGEYLLLTDIFGTVARGNNSVNVDLLLQIREQGKIFITELQHTVSAGGPFILPFRPFLVVNKNADVRIQGVSDTAGAECEAGFQGLFAHAI